MATEAVHKYLKNQNRPYSANDIVQNLHKEFGKTAVQKALDQLTQEQKIIEKVYGKQKVYCVAQEASGDDAQMKQEMGEVEQKIIDLQQQLNSHEDKIKSLENELKNYQGSLTTDEAKMENDRVSKVIEILKTKLKDLSENSVPISPQKKKNIEEQHEKSLKEYRKRKRICMDIINSILEGYPKKKKDLLEELGVETDEDVGFVLGK